MTFPFRGQRSPRPTTTAPPAALLCGLLLLCAVCALPAQGQVVLNELMASNTTTLADERGEYPDWLELYNAGPAALNLSGYGLSDDADDPFQWRLPDLTLDPGGFALVFASGQDRLPSPQQWSTVIDQGHTWRYRADGQEPPADWTDPGFDPAGWASGPSGFGFGDGDDATVLNPSPGLAAYVRTTFTIDAPEDLTSLLLHVDYDDAFVAYLNGTEIARANIGSAGSTRPTVGTPAREASEAQGVQGLPPAAFVVDAPAALLVAGENVLAVQVHNVSTSSSDLSLTPYLTLGYAAQAEGRPAVSAVLDGLPELATARHAPFRLSASGELLLLTAPDGTRADSIAFGPQATDVAYGRAPDGTGDWGELVPPTPEAPNGRFATPAAEAPVFDLDSGHHPGPITVQLTSATPGVTIRYTTDGSLPTTRSPALDASGLLPIATTQVVRARAFATSSPSSTTTTRTFLIGETSPLPVVSITTEPDNLWHLDTGIYADGRNAESAFPHFGANFWEDWEVPIQLAFFEPGTTGGYRAQAGMKIFGGWSRGFAQKSLSLFARKRYGDAAFDHPFFADRPYTSYQTLVLRNSGNDWGRTMLRDGALQTLAQGLDIDRLSYRPTIVLLNGAYWGIHNLREKINEHYVAGVGQLRTEAVQLMEYAEGFRPILGTSDAFDDLYIYIDQTDLTTPAAYAELARRIDLDNFIDYHLAQIYFDNRDWPGNNNKFWRATTDEGRWRWILFDTDFGFGIWDPTAYRGNTLAFATSATGPPWPNPPASTLLLRRLLTNPDIERAFINRFADLMNSTFAVPRAYAVIDSLSALIEPEISRHVALWGSSVSGWNDDINRMRSFALNRPNAMRSHVSDYFGLGGLRNVTVAVNDATRGSVQVNRLTPEAYPWTGSYYTGTLVPLTARPAPGYRFAGWSGSVISAAPVLWVDPASTPSLTATFVAGSTAAQQVRLNEIQYHPADDQDSDAWVELINPTDEAVSVAGWVFQGGDDQLAYQLPPLTVLEPGGYLVLAANPAAFAALHPGVPHVGGWPFGLSNGGEALRLLDDQGAVIDTLTYDDEDPWPTAPDGDGPTLERIDPTRDSTDPDTWRASQEDGGTPGAENSTTIVAREQDEQPPAAPLLAAPYPNPFTQHTTLSYHLPAPGHVTLSVYDVLGRRVALLVDAPQGGGRPQQVRWTAPSLSPGLYFIRLAVDGRHHQTTSVLRLREP